MADRTVEQFANEAQANLRPRQRADMIGRDAEMIGRRLFEHAQSLLVGQGAPVDRLLGSAGPGMGIDACG